MSELAFAVERVWPGRDARFEVLGGGITNHNLKVTIDGEVFVLRVAGKDTGLLGIDRRVEVEATRMAAALGIGPEVVDFVEPEGWLVTRFIEGATPPTARMREPEVLARVAGTLRTFHEAAPIPGTFDAFRVVEAYRDTAVARVRLLVNPLPQTWPHGAPGRFDRIERLIFKNLGKNLTHWERFVRRKIAGTQFTKCYSKTALLRGQMPRLRRFQRAKNLTQTCG